jgi:hypothetical protein
MYLRDDNQWWSPGNNDPAYVTNQWVRYQLSHNGGNANYKVFRYSNGAQLWNRNRANGAISGERVRIGSRHDSWNSTSVAGMNYNVLWDWLFVRPYISVEPTITFGPVETSDNQFCGFAPGTYNFNVMDVGGCNEAESATITQPSAALSLSLSMTQEGCYNVMDGAIDLTVTGGTPLSSPPPSYYYNWAGPGGFSATTEDISGLDNGIYSVTVADDNACTDNASMTVTVLTPINNGYFTWTGNSNQLWQVDGNWDCRVPDQNDDVIIPASPIGVNTPIIQNGIQGNCNTIDIQGNTTDLLDIQPGGLLRVWQ